MQKNADQTYYFAMVNTTIAPFDDVRVRAALNYAIDKGFYKTDSGKPFSFRDAYHPDQSASMKRACAGRVWSIYRRSAPSRNFAADYFRGVESAEDYPLFIKPDKALALADVMDLMRDHYEGTPYDMTKGVDAGPFGSPFRARAAIA